MRLSSFLLALPLMVLASTTHGQNPEALPDCSNDSKCLSLFEQARVQSSAGQLSEALRSYQLAYEAVPDPRLLYSIARVFQKAGQPIDAIPFYRRFIDSKLEDEAQKATARSYLLQCEAAQAVRPERISPPVTVAPAPKAPEPRPVPVYKRWWFWTILGGVAVAGIAAGTAYGITAQQNRIPEPSFRPF